MDIEANVARIERALNTPTLKLLDRKSAVIALPVFAVLFPPGSSNPIPVERFHTQVEALLGELAATGHSVPKASGKALAMQWVRERWLFRDPGEGQETYRPTGDAEQAMDYVNRAARTQLNVSLSRIETMRKVVSDTAMLVNPDREERKRRLAEEIARLTNEFDRLNDGGELQIATESELVEQLSNVLRELDGLPSDFRRVEEAVRDMHKQITKRFREEDRAIGVVVDDYLDESTTLLTGTPEGRAFSGAMDLLRERDWLNSLRQDLEMILAHPLAGMMLPDEISQLRTAVDVIRRGVRDVLGQRQRLTATLREQIENYDHIRNRELDEVLRSIDKEMRTWMQQASPRDHIDVAVIPSKLDLETLKLRTFDPNSERLPEPIASVDHRRPPTLSLDTIRKQGGPNLPKLTEHLDQRRASTGGPVSAADVFHDLPDELRRPVEVFGVLHLFAQRGAQTDASHTDVIEALRPDGSIRALRIPAPTIDAPDHTDQPEGQTHD